MRESVLAGRRLAAGRRHLGSDPADRRAPDPGFPETGKSGRKPIGFANPLPLQARQEPGHPPCSATSLPATTTWAPRSRRSGWRQGAGCCYTKTGFDAAKRLGSIKAPWLFKAALKLAAKVVDSGIEAEAEAVEGAEPESAATVVAVGGGDAAAGELDDAVAKRFGRERHRFRPRVVEPGDLVVDPSIRSRPTSAENRLAPTRGRCGRPPSRPCRPSVVP